MNAKPLLLILTLAALPTAAQTISEIEQEYGQPALAYSVTEHIWMTPEFAADGQVCTMRFYPKRVFRDTPYLGGYLKFEELKWILNSVAPPASRGKRTSSFGLGSIGGGIVETEYEYEKVLFTFIDSIRITIDPDRLGEHVNLDFDVDEFKKPPEPPPPSESDFDEHTKVQIVVLRWKDRTCAKDRKTGSIETVAALEQRYGQPQKTYSVASYMSMTPAFAADGQVCQMSLYPKRVSEGTSVLGTTLEAGAVRVFLNGLAPPVFSSEYFRRGNDIEMVVVRWPQRSCAGF